MEYNRVVYTRPYDAEVEYLESTGTQWIDTGYIHINSHTIEISAQFTRLKSNNNRQRIFGAWQAGSSSMIQDNNSVITFSIGDTVVSHIESDTEKHYYFYDGSTYKGYIDGVTDGNTATKSSSYTTCGLLAQHREGIMYDFSYGRIYYFKVKRNDTYILNLIPVRIGQIGYMYDKVSGQLFGNKGTRNFILGPDVANPVPNIRRVFRFDNKRYITVSNN